MSLCRDTGECVDPDLGIEHRGPRKPSANAGPPHLHMEPKNAETEPRRVLERRYPQIVRRINVNLSFYLVLNRNHVPVAIGVQEIFSLSVLL